MRIYSISSDLKEVKHNFDTNSPFKSNKKVVFMVTLSWNHLCWKLIILIAWSQYPLWALLVWKLYLSSPKQSYFNSFDDILAGYIKKMKLICRFKKIWQWSWYPRNKSYMCTYCYNSFVYLWKHCCKYILFFIFYL